MAHSPTADNPAARIAALSEAIAAEERRLAFFGTRPHLNANGSRLLLDTLIALRDAAQEGTLPLILYGIQSGEQADLLLRWAAWPTLAVSSRPLLDAGLTRDSYPDARAALYRLIPASRPAPPPTLPNRSDGDTFSTPRLGITTMLMLAGNSLRGAAVLEPSAGKGVLALALRERGGQVTCLERDREGRGQLAAEGFTVAGDNLFAFRPATRFQLVVMTPPWKAGAAHVTYAYDHCLAAGGVLIALLDARYRDVLKADPDTLQVKDRLWRGFIAADTATWRNLPSREGLPGYAAILRLSKPAAPVS